jgi:hypothetical protein
MSRSDSWTASYIGWATGGGPTARPCCLPAVIRLRSGSGSHRFSPSAGPPRGHPPTGTCRQTRPGTGKACGLSHRAAVMAHVELPSFAAARVAFRQGQGPPVFSLVVILAVSLVGCRHLQVVRQ